MTAKELWFYDISSDPEELEEDNLFPVQRMYCLDWDAFSKSDTERLARILEQLPHFVGYSQETASWYWFSMDEENDPFLWATEEPPGLHVYGLVPYPEWIAWDQRFRSLTANLPWRVPH